MNIKCGDFHGAKNILPYPNSTPVVHYWGGILFIWQSTVLHKSVVLFYNIKVLFIWYARELFRYQSTSNLVSTVYSRIEVPYFYYFIMCCKGYFYSGVYGMLLCARTAVLLIPFKSIFLWLKSPSGRIVVQGGLFSVNYRKLPNRRTPQNRCTLYSTFEIIEVQLYFYWGVYGMW